MKEKVVVVGLVGSLRKQSYNRGLLEAARELVSPDCSLEIIGLEGIPPYNQDEENTLPSSVIQLKAKVRAADALLIATPEYNYSIPGVLKNGLDWGSRPY